MKPARIVAVLTFFLLPFVGGNHLALFYVNVDKFWIEGIFGLLLVFAVMLLHMEGNRRQSDFLRFLLYFLPFFALTCISYLYSWNGMGTLVSVSTLCLAAGCVYLFLVCPWKESCLAGLVAGATGLAITGILQHFILFPNLASVFQQGMYAHVLKEQSGIPFATFSHHNMLGGYLASVLPLALYFALRNKKRLLPVCFMAASAVMIAGVVLSSTRIGLGITALSVAAACVYLGCGRDWKGIARIGVIMVLAVVVSFSVLHTGGKQKEVAVQGVITHKVKTVYKDLSTLNTRTDIWKNAAAGFRVKPMIGFGAGSFENAYRRFFDGGSYTVAAHSTLMKIAVELGVTGLLCFLFYLIGVVISAAGTGWDRLHVFLFMSAVSAFLFGAVDFAFDVRTHVITFFVLTGALFMREPPVVQGFPKTPGTREGVALFLVVILVLLATLLFTTKAGMMRKDTDSGDLAAENGLIVKALDNYRDAMRAMPIGGDYARVRASSVLIQVMAAEKREDLRASVKSELREYLGDLENVRDRDSERYLIMGRGFGVLGEKDKSDRYFRMALEYYPSSPRYTYVIASYYLSTGRYDTALKLVRGFEQYIPKFRTPHNPRGIFVYRIRDVEASAEFAKGNRERALLIARQNLKDAEAGVYVITSGRSQSFVSRESFIKYLEERVKSYEDK